ncbi:MAG: hypothetical protein EXR74_07315 [Bdellovibrionales bacterium]|nr:hypothetical protein [Bdellovibrionales bacterium]
MPKNPFATYLFSLCDECISLAQELKDILLEERVALITLNTEEILILVSKKESGMMKLVRKRAEIKKIARTQFAEEDLQNLSFSDEALNLEWSQKQSSWLNAWSEVRDVCERNQKFMGHSMKNLDLLVGNLKRLFGQHATYSHRGKRVDQNPEGSVLRGRY